MDDARATLERICKEMDRLPRFQAPRISRPRLSSSRLILIYKTLLQHVWTYFLHLTPFTDKVEEAAENIIDVVRTWMMHAFVRASKYEHDDFWA